MTTPARRAVARPGDGVVELVSYETCSRVCFLVPLDRTAAINLARSLLDAAMEIQDAQDQ